MIRRFVLGMVLLVGCATVPPTDPGQAKVYRFIQAIASEYQVRPPSLMFGASAAGGIAEYRRGLIVVGPKATTYPDWMWEYVVAHEMAHFLLGHDQYMPGPDAVYHQRELDADGLAVQILARVKHIPEREAFEQVYRYLSRLTSVPRGHPPVPVKICDLVKRYPDHAAIVAPLVVCP